MAGFFTSLAVDSQPLEIITAISIGTIIGGDFIVMGWEVFGGLLLDFTDKEFGWGDVGRVSVG